MSIQDNSTETFSASQEQEKINSTQISFKRRSYNPFKKSISVSKDITFNKKLSSDAKILLLALLHAPDDWQVYTSYFREELGFGRERMTTSMNKLIEHGYVRRSQERISNGQFYKYNYEWCEEPIFLETEENSNNFTATGEPDVGKHANTNVYSIYNKTTNPPTSLNPLDEKVIDIGLVGGSIDQKKTEQPPPEIIIYPCLIDLPIDDKDKIRITKAFNLTVVERSVEYCTRPSFKPTSSLVGAIMHYCKNPEHIQVTPEEKAKVKQQEIESKEMIIHTRKAWCEKYATYLRKKYPESHRARLVRVSNDYIEFSNDGSSTKLYFKDEMFKQLLGHNVRKYQIPGHEDDLKLIESLCI